MNATVIECADCGMAVEATEAFRLPDVPGEGRCRSCWTANDAFPVHALRVDASRFQDKHSDENGVSRSLADVHEWDREKAGRLYVWRDPDNGKVYVLNGHNRLDLARRTDQRTIAVRFVSRP